jgi:plastocyanin
VSAFDFRLKVTVVVIALAVLSTTAARKPKTHTVTIDAAQFSPAELTVAAGDTVVWVNRDILAHTATATSKAFDSKTIQPGKSWTFVAKQKGEFPYACSFHPMNGVLRVR